MPTKSGRTSYLYSVRGSGGWTCWWYPHTPEPTHAYNAVTTAANVNDASTPDQLLGIGTRRAGDPLLSPRRAAAMGIRRRRSATTTITGSDAGRLSTRLRGVIRGRRARYVGTGARPGDRAGCWPNRSPPASNPKPLREFDPLRRTGRETCAASRSTPPVNHPRHRRPSRQGRRVAPARP